MDPDQDGYNVGPDLDSNCLKLIVLKKVNFEKSQHSTTHRADKLPCRGCKQIQIHTDCYRIIDF